MGLRGAISPSNPLGTAIQLSLFGVSNEKYFVFSFKLQLFVSKRTVSGVLWRRFLFSLPSAIGANWEYSKYGTKAASSKV